jgi:hypothetical protein
MTQLAHDDIARLTAERIAAYLRVGRQREYVISKGSGFPEYPDLETWVVEQDVAMLGGMLHWPTPRLIAEIGVVRDPNLTLFKPSLVFRVSTSNLHEQKIAITQAVYGAVDNYCWAFDADTLDSRVNKR